MGMDKFKAGDVIQYPDGRQDYLIEIPGEDGLWVNACNTSWIDLEGAELCSGVLPVF